MTQAVHRHAPQPEDNARTKREQNVVKLKLFPDDRLRVKPSLGHRKNERGAGEKEMDGRSDPSDPRAGIKVHAAIANQPPEPDRIVGQAQEAKDL